MGVPAHLPLPAHLPTLCVPVSPVFPCLPLCFPSCFPREAQANFNIYPNEPEIDFSPFGSRITAQDYGDIQYYVRLQKSALSISPATFFNSNYWTIQNVEQ